MGIEFKEELFGLVKLVPFWIKASLVNAIRPEYETPIKPTQVSSIESTTMRLVELKSKEALKYCQLTDADQDLCLNLQTGGIDNCPFKVETICRETQIINGFQRFHKVVPGGKLDVPYVPDSPGTPTKHVEPRIFGIGSSSSPWFQIGVNLRRECRCLTPQEIYSETKTIVDRPCSQPIPWCYVDYDADCLDKEFQFHPVALWWSQEACRRETSLFSNSYVDFNYYK
ncbi:uncharacterized protein LOC131880887 [Tigriopus californicus]|nr:uncharacterized protein LOC131880887 [Tigriopus californicus]